MNVVANLVLILFLFLVGLETDIRFLVSNCPKYLSCGHDPALRTGLCYFLRSIPRVPHRPWHRPYQVRYLSPIHRYRHGHYRLPGALMMSCKGLAKLIVLNIGLQAKILSTRTFTITVVMALVTTFLTTPLTTALYPTWYQVKVERWRRGEIDWDGQRT